MENEYRICKNKYGYFKVQQWAPERKVLFIFKAGGKWRDTGYEPYSENVRRYTSSEEAEAVVQGYITKRKVGNDNWDCNFKK